MDHANSLQAIDVATYQQYINGAFKENDHATEYIEVIDPCSEQVIARVPRGKRLSKIFRCEIYCHQLPNLIIS